MSFAADALALDVESLFREARMFDSRDRFGAEGFELFDRQSESKIMVASHRRARGCLFKKYGPHVSSSEQAANYARRVEGAEVLRRFVEQRRLQHVVVPRKLVRELPARFSGGRVLVVEQLDVRSAESSSRRYRDLDADVLRELCVVFYAFRGLDSTPKNVPLTRDGKLAFIDTEHWDRHLTTRRRRDRDKPYLRHLREHLSSSRRSLADEIFEELEERRGEI